VKNVDSVNKNPLWYEKEKITFLDKLFSAHTFWEKFIRRNPLPPTVPEPQGGLLLPGEALPQSHFNQFPAIQIFCAV
jgi:hypothetical protein